MNENIHVIIGYLAACLTTISFLPQAIKTIRSRCTRGISVAMYALFTIGVFFWCLYGILVKDCILISANIITFIFALPILVISIKNSKSI